MFKGFLKLVINRSLIDRWSDFLKINWSLIDQSKRTLIAGPWFDLTLPIDLTNPFTQHFSQNLDKYLNQPLAKPVTQPSLSLTIPLTHPTQPFTHPDTNPPITLPTWLQLMLLNLNIDWGCLETKRRILKLNSNTKSKSVFVNWWIFYDSCMLLLIRLCPEEKSWYLVIRKRVKNNEKF